MTGQEYALGERKKFSVPSRVLLFTRAPKKFGPLFEIGSWIERFSIECRKLFRNCFAFALLWFVIG